MINPHLNLDPNWEKSLPRATREGFGEAILEIGRTNDNLLVLTADLADSLKLDPFIKAHPGKFLEIGIAEQNLVGIAAGLASIGFIPLACSYAVFSPGRNWDQIRVSVCYSNLDVKIVSSHAGLSVGPDGAVHQALEDIALMRVLPNMTIISPCDYVQSQLATRAMIYQSGPTYLRLHRQPGPVITSATTPFKIGVAQTLRFGKSVTIVTTGLMVAESLKAAEEIDAEVINVHTIKPLDINAIIQSLKKTGKLIVVEEHQLAGGLGSSITEALAEIYPVPTRFVAVRDQFGQSGTPDELWQAYGLTWEHIISVFKTF